VSSPITNPTEVTLDPNRNTASIAGPGSYQLLTIPANEMLRLLRDDWTGPNGAKMLSEEIYAIMAAAVASGSQTGQMNLNQPAPGTYPFVINTADNSGIKINGPKGSALIGPGGITLAGTPPAPVGAGVGAGGGIPGLVLGGGPGQGPYSVQLYPNNLSTAGATVSCTQLQIDPAETIPPGTWTMVSLMPDHTYTMQVPVWLA
jgi:hypothetical protein